MSNSLHNKNTYKFGEYRLSGLTEQLFCHNEHIRLEPQLFNLLLLLVSNYGEVVNRQQVQDAVWAGRPVSDEAIRVAIKKLRDVFKDDAKSPRFVKTLPRQGYRWLAPVELEQADIKESQRNTTVNKVVLLGGAFVAIIFSLSFYMFWSDSPSTNKPINSAENNENNLKVELLTSLPGSEIYADYHQPQNKLAFLHRDARNSPQQLYIKYLETGVVKRLSWDNANYSNGAWSKDGKRLAFNRLSEQTQTLHILEFDELGDVDNFLTLNNPKLADKFVLEWMHDQSGLLLAHEFRPNRQHSIYQYSINSDTLQTISSPNVAGRGDYFAGQSHDGSKLAILREVGQQQTSLLVLEMQTGSMLVNKTLPFQATKLAWQKNDEGIILSNFFGQSSRYILKTDFFDDYPKLPNNSLDIFNSCGERCYVLRQHNGNFLDIQETPLSLLLSRVDAQDVTKEPLPILDSGRLFKLPGAQDLPRYLVDRTTGSNKAEKELVYVSLINKELFFKKRDEHNQTQTLGKLQGTYQLSAISVSADAKNVAGVADGRLFLLGIETDLAKPEFLTNALELVDNPSWHIDNQRIYLTSMSENIPSIILFNTSTKEREPIISGFAAFQQLIDTPELAVGIEVMGTAWMLSKTSGKWQKQYPLTKIDSHNLHDWQAINGTLYFSRMRGSEAQICMFSLEPSSPQQEPKCASTGHNRFRLSFDIHPTQNKVLLVESLGAQSNIIKMSW